MTWKRLKSIPIKAKASWKLFRGAFFFSEAAADCSHSGHHEVIITREDRYRTGSETMASLGKYGLSGVFYSIRGEAIMEKTTTIPEMFGSKIK